MNVYVVTAVDHGDNCDGKARVLGCFSSWKNAEACVKSDMEDWMHKNAEEGVEADYTKMRTWFDYSTADGCEWSIDATKLN